MNVAYEMLAANRDESELAELDYLLEDDTPAPSRADRIAELMAWQVSA